MDWVSDCLFMCCCGPLAVLQQEDETRNKPDQCSDNCMTWLCCCFVPFPDFFGVLSNGIYLGQQKHKRIEELGCYELCCTPCFYAQNKSKEKNNSPELISARRSEQTVINAQPLDNFKL